MTEVHDSALLFDTTVYDFGTLAYESEAEFSFRFTNTGNKPLTLRTVRTSCNCTVPEWPRKPIDPGAQGIILVSYNTSISGTFSKTISVYYNQATQPVRLRITGRVKNEDS
jgi:hypothetical protein